MPRRGSKPWLVHLLVDFDAWAEREVLGNHDSGPGDFYDRYRDCSLAELRDWAGGLTPRKVGRPKKRRSRYAWLAAEVDDVLKSGKRKSERGACKYVAGKHRASETALRTFYRDRHGKR